MCAITSIFFFVANKLDITRMTEQNEILGGDTYYFGPKEFQGIYEDFNTEMIRLDDL